MLPLLLCGGSDGFQPLKAVSTLPVNTNYHRSHRCLRPACLSLLSSKIWLQLTKEDGGCWLFLSDRGPEHELALSFPESARATVCCVLHLWTITPFCVFCSASLPHELWHLNWKHLKVKQMRLKLWTGVPVSIKVKLNIRPV